MADRLGPIIAPPGQYTHCVERTAYRDIPGPLQASAAEILEFVLCDYLLGGKLVCLAGGGDECAIGIVVGLEQVGVKTGFDAIDNDFSFNVLLVPYQPDDFPVYGKKPVDLVRLEPHKIWNDVKRHSPLGRLMDDPAPSPPLPRPMEETGAPLGPANKDKGTATWPMDGYGVVYKWAVDRNGVRTFDYDDFYKEGYNLHKLWDQPPKKDKWPPPPPRTGESISVPVIHCECEGSRIFFVCQALKPFLELLQGKIPGSNLPGAGEACHAALGWLPFGIGDAVCSIAQDLIDLVLLLYLAPIMAAAFASAWEAAQAYDDLFVTGPVAKQIHVGDVVVVTGRWTWDAGHSGHTELHPVKTIQKVMTSLNPSQLPPDLRPAGSFNPQETIPDGVFDAIRKRHHEWSRLVSQAPPLPDPRQPGSLSPPQLASLTPEQLTVYTDQRKPENAWVVHPSIDGCTPQSEPQRPPR